VDDVRIALGSVAPVPIRLRETELAVKGRAIDSALLLSARTTAMAEINPIDDIRSTSKYRSAVAGNLVVEFLHRLDSDRSGAERDQADNVLARWNLLPPDDAMNKILPCCGSKAWARAMVARRPLADEGAILAASNEVWRSLPRSDWMEAFESHPRIGGTHASVSAAAQSVTWSAQEQCDVTDAGTALKNALADANQEYERRFNRIFIVCATGKSAADILAILQLRMANDEETELQEAAEQQRQIMEIRVKKWIQRIKQG
jgi:2-oxo-4-hydroxy-4-carboxy-5-ureidoimidazoline decarboxylase